LDGETDVDKNDENKLKEGILLFFHLLLFYIDTNENVNNYVL